MNTTTLDLLHEKEVLLQSFLQTRTVTEDLVKDLSPEDMLLSVTQETSPIKWHLAHTSWFFDKFMLRREGQPSEMDFLFNSYYRGMGEFLPKSQRGAISRPGLSEVITYRRSVTEQVAQWISLLDGDSLKKERELLWIGVHHEKQHQELILMDIKRNFFENPLRPRYGSIELKPASSGTAVSWENIPSGLYKVGQGMSPETFSYDNEGDSHFRWIDSFMLRSHLVTNEEYLEFIEAGGYENSLLWLSDGWDAKLKHNWKFPLYWEERDGSWWTMSLAGMIPLDGKAPVAHLSYYEADAFARFKGCRLPTEFEWEVAAQSEPVQGEFLTLPSHDPGPAENTFERFAQIHGTLWEWTQSAYLPYPRYRPWEGEITEYNGKFMCNQMVLRGGSSATPVDHYRASYRNFYYPENRWQFSGLRLAKDLL